MKNFNALWEKLNENIKFHETPQIGSMSKTSGFSPDINDGYDPENVNNLNVSEELEERIKDLIMSSNLYDPTITEDEEVINSALKDFLRRIKK